VFKTISIILCAILLSGCFAIDMNVWGILNGGNNTFCPDSDFDNGGGFKPLPGICKSGTGGMVFLNYEF
jgi:hypothetical protein